MKAERVIEVFLIGLLVALTLTILFAPSRARASLVIFPNTATSTNTGAIVPTTPSRLVTGPLYAVTTLPLNEEQKKQIRIAELKAELARLYALLVSMRGY